jgi:hypothetical protein
MSQTPKLAEERALSWGIEYASHGRSLHIVGRWRSVALHSREGDTKILKLVGRAPLKHAEDGGALRVTEFNIALLCGRGQEFGRQLVVIRVYERVSEDGNQDTPDLDAVNTDHRSHFLTARPCALCAAARLAKRTRVCVH